MLPCCRYTAEFNRILAHVRAGTQVVALTRIQDKPLWRSYHASCELLSQRPRGAANEKLLFHGARNNHDTIKKEGFRHDTSEYGSARRARTRWVALPRRCPEGQRPSSWLA